MNIVIASVTNIDLGIWGLMLAGGVCAEYFIGIARRIRPHK